jgi:hypothetical protein
MQALDDMNAYDRVLMDKITKHFKDRPEIANNQLQQFYLGMQLRNRIAAREKAEKDGDVYLSRNLENDDIFAPKPSYGCRWCHFRKSNGGPCQW